MFLLNSCKLFRSPLSALRSPLSALRSPLSASLLALTLVAGVAQAQSQGQDSRWWEQNRPASPTQPRQQPRQSVEPERTAPAARSQTASPSSTSQPAATSSSRASNPLRQGPSYTWIQVDFIKQDVPYHYIDLNYDGYDEDLDTEYGFFSNDIDGFRLSGSVALGQYFYFTGRYNQISYKRLRYWEEPNYFEDEVSTVDISQLRLGIGAHRSLFAHTDLIIEGGVLYSRRTQKGDIYSYDSISKEEEEEIISDRRSSGGSYLNVGWRSQPIDQIELFQELRWFNINDKYGRRAISIAHGVHYFIVPNFGLSVGIEAGEKDMLDYEVGLRARF